VTLVRESGRLQLVTIPALRSRGADKFCWLGPGEVFSHSSSAEEWVPTVTGGFLYVLSGGMRPIYFSRDDVGEGR
jgi:hypothetical protein